MKPKTQLHNYQIPRNRIFKRYTTFSFSSYDLITTYLAKLHSSLHWKNARKTNLWMSLSTDAIYSFQIQTKEKNLLKIFILWVVLFLGISHNPYYFPFCNFFSHLHLQIFHYHLHLNSRSHFQKIDTTLNEVVF